MGRTDLACTGIGGERRTVIGAGIDVAGVGVVREAQALHPVFHILYVIAKRFIAKRFITKRSVVECCVAKRSVVECCVAKCCVAKCCVAKCCVAERSVIEPSVTKRSSAMTSWSHSCCVAHIT